MESAFSTPESPAEQIAALRADLDQREATIDLLARQLEDAANRLDWISRCGPDNEGSAKTPESSPHNAANSLSPQIGRFLEQWEAADVSHSLESIDRRLSHLFELLKAMDRTSDRSETAASRPAEAPAAPASGSLLTAFLLAQSADQTGSATSESRSRESEAVNRTELSPAASQSDVCPLPLPDFTVPQPVDVDAAAIEDLRTAVMERDECIQQLLHRSRVAEAQRTICPDWESLKAVPDELCQRVAQLEADLQQRLKQEMLSSSIERAKLFRDRAHLDQVRKELEAQIRGLGRLQQEANPPADDCKTSAKRWSKLFGR